MMHECVSVYDRGRKAGKWASTCQWMCSMRSTVWLFAYVCVCVCVWSVRWGQRSQPADASEASGAGSQGGRSQTLIRETHHTAFPVFTTLAKLSHRHRVSFFLFLSNLSYLLLVTKHAIEKKMSLHNIYYVENLLNRAYFPPARFTRAPHKIAHSGKACLCALCLMYVCTCVYWQEGAETQWEKCIHVSARPGWHSLAHQTPVVFASAAPHTP